MAHILMRNKFFIIPILLCIGCTDTAYFLASEAYKKQPQKKQLKFVGSEGVYDNIDFNINNYKYNNKDKYFIAIASSGGGYRASLITLGVMLELENAPSIKGKNNFLTDVDMFSTISGSGLSVGYYIAKIFDNPEFNLNHNIQSLLNKDQKTHKSNILRTNLDKILFNQNTAKIQEHIKKILITDKGQLKLRDIFINQSQAEKQRIPLWLINSTIFQNMEGISLTPSTLVSLGVNKSKAESMNASEALMASMAYPMAIPPLKLVSKKCQQACYIYLIDGGVFDATGIIPILNVSKQVTNKYKLLIVIDSSENMSTPYSKSPEAPSPLDLLEKIPSMVTENQSQRVKHDLKLLNKDTKAVILKASKFKAGIGITTRLNASLEEQKMLIQIGRNLVKSSQQLQGIIQQWK